MPRVKTANTLLATNITKINKWAAARLLDNEFIDKFKALCLKEVKAIKECSEKLIVENYIRSANELILNNEPVNDDFWERTISKARLSISNNFNKATKDQNTIDIYFNEVKREYIKHPQNEQDELLFCDENRDTFIKNNLKLVVSCAKRYRNFGVPFEDLIQAGNYGLCLAFDRFDQERANLQRNIINNINNSISDCFTYNEAVDIIKSNYQYSKSDITSKLPEEGFDSREDFIVWVQKNVKKAIFASVAFQWIRAYIMIEIRKNNKVIKNMPQKKDDEDEIDDEMAQFSNSKNSLSIIYLDSENNYTNDCYHDGHTSEVTSDNFLVEEKEYERESSIEYSRGIIDELLNKLSGLEKRIIKKRFGIGYPYQLTPAEIAYNEGINVTKVKNLIQSGLSTLAKNIPEDKIQMLQDLIYD